MKKLLYGLAGLVLLILLAAIVLTQWVDTDRVKRLLVEQTKEKTGRTLVINGDLSWRFFPSIGFTVTDAALLNPPQFEGGNTLAVGELSLDVALQPLFNQRLEIGEAVLKNARLHLITRADGTTNIDDLRELAQHKEAAAQQIETSDKTLSLPQENNAPNAQKKSLDVTLAGVQVQDGEVVMQNQGTGKLTRLTKVNVKLDEFAPDNVVPLNLSANLFSDDIQAYITLDGKFWLAPELNRFSINDLVLETSATGRAIPGNKQLKLQGQLSYDIEQKLAEFSELNLAVGELNVSGELALRQQSVPELSFNLHTPSLNLDALQKEWQTGTPGVSKKSASKANRQSSASNSKQKATPITPTSVPATLSSSTPTSEASKTWLHTLDLEGDLAADTLIIQGVELEQLAVHIKSKQGKLELNPIQAQLYEGHTKGQATLNFSEQPTTFRLQQQLSQVNAKALLSATTDIDYLEGLTDISLIATGEGFSDTQLQKNLNASAELKMRDGALEGVNVTELIQRAHAKVKGLPVPVATAAQKTDFSELAADFALNKGVVSTDNLHLVSPLLRIDGQGQTKLADESMDILLNTAVVGSIKDQEGEEIDELKNIILPIRISGTYKEPQYRLDLQQVFDIYLGDKTDKEMDRLKRKLDGKLGDKLEKKLGDKLPGLLDKLGL
ncbi:AsmA family protein [Oceanisphaera avium]|uniref:AsmA family protein n=1 Tax=Oceanisphaera avium TaxID=1903694 RepID=A0A1Y0CVX8_9GAMM|nr:AsmA family protein [Oceanisphaera avium]ART79368.1 AsmA family protein [Oceanisphaera avium]